MHRPGIEPGPPAWQASILPLNQRCWLICSKQIPSSKQNHRMVVNNDTLAVQIKYVNLFKRYTAGQVSTLHTQNTKSLDK